MDRNHCDGGLVNKCGSSHVISAVQALLHSQPMLSFLESDENHRTTCRSLLQCMMCQLHKIWTDMRQNGIGDPSSLVFKWGGISTRMTTEKKMCPLNVLVTFLDVLRLQHCGRKTGDSPDEFFSHPISNMWTIPVTMEVSCSSCGQFKRRWHLSFLELTDVAGGLADCLLQELFEWKEGQCPQCMMEGAKISHDEVCLPQCVIIHLKRCTEGFVLPFEFELPQNKLTLKAIISQPEGGTCFFIGVCPDGCLRKFEDTKITNISPARLFAPAFTQRTKLTLIYEKDDKVSQQNVLATQDHCCNFKQKKGAEKAKVLAKEDHGPRHSGQKRNEKVTVVGFPDLSALSISPDEEVTQCNILLNNESTEISCGVSTQTTKMTCEVSTQTCASVKDVEVQTGPFANYEVCEDFAFWTGISREDFYALYDLIGGHDVISILKIDYRPDTPQKIRETRLSSYDKLYLFLLRLRRGLPLEEMSQLFGMGIHMISAIFYVMMRLIYLTFKGMESEMFISADAQRKNKPKKMKPFTNLRILLDGVSFRIETPSNFQQQGNSFSKYKKGNVLVFTVGISCNGATIFCSPGMEGSMSDKEVVIKSGLLERLSKGDGVMTDRGYELTAELLNIGCYFYKPPTRGPHDFTPEEEILTKAIASTRIYTEHAMADIKDNRLLRGTIPLTMLPILDNLVYIAAYLRNFNPPRIHDKTFVVRNNEDDALVQQF